MMSGGVAQLVEQRTENPCVTSSILVLATIFFALMAKKHEAALVLRNLGEEGRLRFMPHRQRFIILWIASYGEAVLYSPACR